MMELNDIIDAANLNIKEGTLILHRSMEVHHRFKVYKEFIYCLYYVVNGNKKILSQHRNIENVPENMMDAAWAHNDILYLRELIRWFASEEYKSMLKDGI